MHPLRCEIAAKALSRKEDGKPLFSLSALAEQYGCSNSTVSRYRDKYAETDKVEDKLKENHGEEKLSEREQRVLLRIFQKESSTSHRSATEKLANNHDTVISPSTARSYLKGFGLTSYMKAIKPTLNAIVKKKRYQFALKYKHKTLEWWKKLFFSDEGLFHTGDLCYRTRVWRHRGQKYCGPNVQQRARGKNLMVWGWFSYNEVGRIVEVKGKIDSDAYIQILDETLPRDEEFILLQDNAPAHASEDTYNWTSEEDIDVIKDFPPYSPDLNPIEHVWGRMKRHLMISPASSKEDLWEKLNSIWLGLPLGYLKILVESMSRRIHAVIKARGGYTKY